MREISLLGTSKVESNDGKVPRFRSQLTMALLGYVVTERRTVTREHLAALFWPDDGLKQGRAKLRRELHNLTQILPGCWEIDRLRVRFRLAAGTSLDLDALREHQARGEWQAAARLLRGDFLEGVTLGDNLEFETWLLGEQERWRQRGAYVMSELLDDLAEQGRLQEALRCGRRLLRTNPWNEDAHHRMMLLLMQAGQPLAALRQFAGYERFVLQELGVSPSSQMLDLIRQIKSEMARPAHNLPVPSGAFFGRERELAEIGKLLTGENSRLLTLTGPGGIGKTRLALEAARRHYQAVHIATFFVSLQGVQSASVLARAIAAATNFSFAGPLEPCEQLLSFLQVRRMLLVLDNFEHLLGHAPLLNRLLASAPDVRLLVTSQERLNLQGETVYVVDGLDYAMNGETSESSSFQLFTQSAQYLRPAYRPSLDDAIAIRRICRLAGGLPLAIELAAGWTNILTPGQLAAELEDGLRILSTQTRDVPARHVSIEAAFNHSWQMLSDAEQRTMEKLSVFAGDFDLDAATHIVGANPLLLQSLVNKSLLSANGAQQFRLHELLRQFTVEKLAGDAHRRQQVLRAHCAYYTRLLHRYELETKEDLASISGNILRIRNEINNMLAAWVYAVDHHLVEEINRSIYSLNLYFEFLGHYREGMATFEMALRKWEQSEMELDVRTQMRLLTHYGWLAQDLKQENVAKQSLDKAYELSGDLSAAQDADRSLLLFFYGWTLHFQGESSSGMAYLRRGLTLGEAAGYEFGKVLNTLALAEIANDLRDYDAAFNYASRTPEDMGPFLMSLKMGHLALANAAVGNFSEAEIFLLQLVDMLYDFPMIPSMLYTCVGIASLAGHMGKVRLAVELLAVCLNHPQFGGFAFRRAESLLNEFKVKVSKTTFEESEASARAGRLEHSWLERVFEVDAQTIKRLTKLLDMVIKKTHQK